MQTLVFNTTTKSVKLYQEFPESSPVIMIFNDVPTVKIMINHYEVIQSEFINGEDRRVPVARFPVLNTNMLIVK